MTIGFMFEITNQCPFPISFASSGYQGTGDISPFDVTVGPNQNAPGAPQNPGYYYYEMEAGASEGQPLTVAGFCVTVTVAATSDWPLATTTMDVVMEDQAQVLSGPACFGAPSQTISISGGTTLAACGGSLNVTVSQSGTVGKDEWPLGRIVATFTAS